MNKFFLSFTVILSVSYYANLSNAKIIERVVAIVNDQIITETDIREYRSQLKGGNLNDDLLVSDSKALLASRKKLIDYIISEKLVDSEVKKLNLSATVEQVEKEIRIIAKGNRISRNQLKAALKNQGIKFSDYQEFVRKRIERQSLTEQTITSKIKISDEDVLNYHYQKNPEASRLEKYQYTLSHILFRPKNGDVKAANDRAQKVSALLQKGEGFESMASKYSEDLNFSSGGMLGTFNSGEISKAFEDAVKNLNEGEVSTVVKSRSGFHILKVNEKKPLEGGNLPAAQKDRIRKHLYEQAFKKQFSFWLDQKRRQAFIKIN